MIDKTTSIRTVCSSCARCCGIQATVREGILTRVEPADFPIPGLRHICLRGLATPELVYHKERIKYPLKRVGERGAGKWEQISWDNAFDIIAQNFLIIGEKYGYECIAFPVAIGGHGALVSSPLRLASAMKATWVDVIGFGDSAGPCGDRISYGSRSFEGQHYSISFDNPKMCVLWGANYAETQPFYWRTISHAHETGTRVVVIDPRFTPSAAKADEYISIRPGTDTALALGMIRVIIKEGLVDNLFVRNHTVGPLLVRNDNGLFLKETDLISGGTEKYLMWDSRVNQPVTYDSTVINSPLTGTYQVDGIACKPAFQLLLEMVEPYTPERTSDITEIPSTTIKNLAISYATQKPVNSFRGMGLQRTFYGDLAYRAVTTLAAITGNIRLKGNHSAKLNLENFTTVPGFGLNSMPLLQMYEAIEKGQPHWIKALWIGKHNMVNQNGDRNRTVKLLRKNIDFIVVADMLMNETALYADVVLPVSSFYERHDLITPSGVPYLQLQQKVIDPLYESKSDLDIISALASKMGFGDYFSQNAEAYIDSFLASMRYPEKVTFESLKTEPVYIPAAEITTFPTPSGRIEFYSERMKPFEQELPVYIEPLENNRSPLSKKYPLNFISSHSKYHCHSRFINVPFLRELDPEPVLEMNFDDAESRKIKDGDIVIAFNDRGKVKLKVIVHKGLKAGIVNIREGWWEKHYYEGSHQALTHGIINIAQMAVYQPNTAFNDCLVEVCKEEEYRKSG